MRPYILIEISDVDENDLPVFEMEFGGGLDQDGVTDLLIGIGAALDEDNGDASATITPLD